VFALIASASPDSWETLGLIASVVSTALAIFAIWQAYAFHRLSSISAEQAQRAANSMADSIRKLEDLFSHMYGDASAPPRDAATYMPRHGQPRRAAGQRQDETAEAVGDAVNETIRSRLMPAIRHARHCGRTMIRADDLLGPLFEEFPPEDVHNALAKLRSQGIVDWHGDGPWIEGSDVQVYLVGLPPTLRRGYEARLAGESGLKRRARG
jgi:hypothetical protein